MPSVSKAQQRFMGLVHAYKKGEVPASQVSQAVKDAAKSMKKKSTKKFASTKHDDLPNKVRSENMNEDGHTDVASAKRKLKLIMKDAMDTLNALRSLSNEDSLPSWWTDKITLAKDYVGKSRDYIMNPAESVNETPQKVAKLLIKYGNNTKDVKDMIKKHYKTAKKDRSKSTPSELANYISFLSANESVNEAERKMSSLEMQQIILLAKAMREMPGSPAQKKIKKQINVIRKKLGQAPVKESVNEVSGVDVAKRVLKNKQYEKGIDLQTANLIVTIDKAYDKNPKLQKKFRALQLPKMKQLILKYYG